MSTEFNWDNLYQEAEDAWEASKERFPDIVKALEGKGLVINDIQSILADWANHQEEFTALVIEELGDAHILRFREGTDITYANLSTESGWRFLIALAFEFKNAGRYSALQKLQDLFNPEGNLFYYFLDQVDLVMALNGYEVSDEQFDAVLGSILDLKPGVADVRDYTANGNLNVDGLSIALTEYALTPENCDGNGEIFAECAVEIQQTMENVERLFGNKVKEVLWDAFLAGYNESKGSSDNQ